MGIYQGRSNRKNTGGKLKTVRKKRKSEIGRELTATTLSPKKAKQFRTRGANQKICLLTVDVASVMDTKTNKAQKTKILNVLENPANPNYVRRNIITKGAVIETEAGKARVTSRPGQSGVINAVLIA